MRLNGAQRGVLWFGSVCTFLGFLGAIDSGKLMGHNPLWPFLASIILAVVALSPKADQA